MRHYSAAHPAAIVPLPPTQRYRKRGLLIIGLANLIDHRRAFEPAWNLENS